jgi:hypothetical protein
MQYSQILMIVNMLTQECLWRMVDEAYEESKQGCPQGLARLARQVETKVIFGQNGANFDAADYLYGFQSGVAVFRYPPNPTRQFYRSTEPSSKKFMVQILAHWLNLPDQPKYSLQAKIVREIVNRAGIDLLLVKRVADLCNNPKRYIGNGINKVTEDEVKVCRFAIISSFRPVDRDMQIWADTVLSIHPVCQEGSPERQLLTRLHMLLKTASGFNDLYLRTLKLPNPAISAHRAPSVLGYVPNSEGSAQNTLSLSSQVFSKELSRLVRMLTILYAFLDSPNNPCNNITDKATKEFLRHVQKVADKKLPFRELAPSRMRILQPGGPFDPAHVSTPHAFFSAIVFRAITFGTRFLQEQTTMFQSLEEYRQLCAQLKDSGDSYFEDCNAYGAWTQPCRPFAEEYWKAARDPKFNYWLTAPELIPFTDLYKLFDKSKYAQKTKVFPGLGPLKSYLLAADYALAGKAQLPTKEELGKIIHYIGKGARTGLMYMGLDCSTAENTASSFGSVVDALEATLAVDRKLQMQFSPMIVEHVLCKLSRLDIAKFRAVEKSSNFTT